MLNKTQSAGFEYHLRKGSLTAWPYYNLDWKQKNETKQKKEAGKQKGARQKGVEYEVGV